MCVVAVATALTAAALHPNARNGAEWTDTDGRRINCHGGCIIAVDSVYYWYGEHRPGFDADRQKGVSCYSSTDLLEWRNEGIVLEVSDAPGVEPAAGGIIERPKVVYCPNTGKYVMWFHRELPGQGYGAAHAAVAQSDGPLGPFRFIRSGRVNAGIYPLNFTPTQPATSHEWWTPGWREAVRAGMFAQRDLEGGQMARDMTIFVDDDGKAYHVYASEENLTLHIAELTDDYTAHTGRYVRVAPGGQNEAPVMFRHGGKYWIVTSGCTGWAPNMARLLCSDSIFGEWTEMPSPCIGENWQKTFGGQGAFALNVGGETYFVADVWNPGCLADSRYLILPVLFNSAGTPVIPYVGVRLRE